MTPAGPGTGPRVVAVGGGHGLAATLRAVRTYAGEIDAIVSVADDGGSSGRLREAFGIPAPGDARKCLVALAEEGPDGPGPLWARAFEHRFEGSELEGHAFGNLVIAGLAEACGDFASALREAGRILGAVGRVLPATEQPVVLKADVGGRSVEGQLAITGAAGITTISLVPADPSPPPAALEALAAADQIVIGPGSLFTSVLAVVAVPALATALAASPATKVYVCNLAEQVPETVGFDVAAHLRAIAAHGLDVDVVVCHPGALPPGDLAGLTATEVRAEVSRRGSGVHDPALLGAVLARLAG